MVRRARATLARPAGAVEFVVKSQAYWDGVTRYYSVFSPARRVAIASLRVSPDSNALAGKVYPGARLWFEIARSPDVDVRIEATRSPDSSVAWDKAWTSSAYTGRRPLRVESALEQVGAAVDRLQELEAMGLADGTYTLASWP